MTGHSPNGEMSTRKPSVSPPSEISAIRAIRG